VRILFDTNVVLDLLLDRDPFVKEAQQLISKVEQREVVGVLGATTVTTIHYLVSKSLGKEIAKENMEILLKIFEVADVTKAVLIEALLVDDRDFEDSVLYKAGYYDGCNFIVTRDRGGFEKSEVPVMNPKELLAVLESLEL